jgi:2-oxoglutarate dehydrogenase E1 component
MQDDLPLATALSFLDEMYATYRRDPAAVDPSWRKLFDYTPTRGTNGTAAAPITLEGIVTTQEPAFLAKVWALVNAFRARGHFEARLDPLGLLQATPHPEIDPRAYGLTDGDLDRIVPGGYFNGPENVSLRELIRRARATYCGTIGVEFMHISSPTRKAWLHQRMEKSLNKPNLDRATKLDILEKLARAETFERFVHTKYVGTRRFSLEGSETLIPLLDIALEYAVRQGVDEAVLGMAHRGRLNVLAHIVGKPAKDIFAEFEDIDPQSTFGSGDVKYHLGFSSDIVVAGKKIHLSLTFNPSHLEAVDPVVVGRVRAKQRRIRDELHHRVIGILVHGDAAFAGQGLVAETLNLSEIHGYRTGGTLHVLVNNQIGFTATPAEARSTPYATDVAKMLQCPIFHVNGDDPEAVAQVVQLAMEYRHEYKTDVVIDMFCYRKYGHNEADEPSFTQPLMYTAIEHHPSVVKIYADKLVGDGTTTPADVDALLARVHQELESELKLAKATSRRPGQAPGQGVWKGFVGGSDRSVPDVDTGVPRERLMALAERATELPPSFHPHPKIARLLEQRRQMGRGEHPFDWAGAEMLAFASLVTERRMVRLSGQDTCRGTFSQRHAVIVDVQTGEEHAPLQHMAEDQADFRIYDSALSEAAVLGFEFGYSLDFPEALIGWEAQFGDFVNGAQVIIDNFVSSSEDKWKRISGLVMLLPHGYEGQGPEHSSARPERFLQLAAEDNMQVCYPTTPAQYFHLLRRQVVRKWRKPLVVFTPKSLLRHPLATSKLDDLATGRFQRVLGDDAAPPPADVKRLVLCCGKLFYDLHEARKKRGDQKTAIVRIEQLYPWRDEEVGQVLDRFNKVEDVVFAQEEPANMGFGWWLEPRLRRLLGRSPRMACRVESASPATGSNKAHQIEQAALVDEALR